MRNSWPFSEVPLAFARRCLDSGCHFALKRAGDNYRTENHPRAVAVWSNEKGACGGHNRD